MIALNDDGIILWEVLAAINLAIVLTLGTTLSLTQLINQSQQLRQRVELLDYSALLLPETNSNIAEKLPVTPLVSWCPSEQNWQIRWQTGKAVVNLCQKHEAFPQWTVPRLHESYWQ